MNRAKIALAAACVCIGAGAVSGFALAGHHGKNRHEIDCYSVTACQQQVALHPGANVIYFPTPSPGYATLGSRFP